MKAPLVAFSFLKAVSTQFKIKPKTCQVIFWDDTFQKNPHTYVVLL